MGLDMNLYGRKRRWLWDGEASMHVDGFPVNSTTLELDVAYWRKHPNLHGYIVREFAGGVDECQEIELNAGDLKKILAASEADELPHTSGFFFGESGPEDKEPTRKKLEAAIKWLETKDPDERTTREVVYRASW
jgi:hypothetical protein